MVIMALAILYCRARDGVNAPLVTVEVHLANGLPALSIVGLPELAVRESRDRVRGAIINSRFEFPARRITINLAPADLPKEGGRFDLPIALGILIASGQIPGRASTGYEFAGELALSGEIRPITGIFPVALAARDAGRALVVPSGNAAEAALVDGISVFPSNHLLDVCGHLNGSSALSPHASSPADISPTRYPDLAEVRGQANAKRALEIAAAGGHSLLMMGPPGSGKSMLAGCLPAILPPMTEQEALESAAVLSISEQGFRTEQWKRRPFRAPHHTASAVALVGGGSNPRPGEISLAHNGVMFLDELPEFDRRVLEVLREPLESGRITISRAARQADFPASFQFIAAMNPCPCGHLGDSGGRGCRCTADQVQRYRSRISGPLLDRIDMHLEVPRVPAELLRSNGDKEAEESSRIRERVAAARRLQLQRCNHPNGKLQGRDIERHCTPDPQGLRLLHRALEQLGLSARAYHRVLKLARTIADLAGTEQISAAHVSEAIGFRRLDRRP
jgi:magnesium chelatase family protein